MPKVTGAGQGCHTLEERNRFVGTALAASRIQAPDGVHGKARKCFNVLPCV